MKAGAGTLYYTLTDYYRQVIQSGQAPVAIGKDGTAQAVVSLDADTARTVYMRGRLKAFLAVCDASGAPVCTDVKFLDRFSFAQRDNKELPALPETMEDTPYGNLKLVDEIDCASSEIKDDHPYMQGGFDHAGDRMTPGAPLKVTISDILGKKARETEMGYFAYRIGRGKLVPHQNYVLRVEYPEDKPRFAPFEIQNGHNYMDIGWRNGVSADDPYDNWPLSQKWQWYDAMISLDEETTGTYGSGSASAEHGIWLYFMNKKKPGRYFDRYAGGCAIARLKLYEIDPEKNAPVINKPKDLPQRTLMVDWERQADQPPEDIVRYCKLMGYNTVSPIMLKWTVMNYGEPLAGTETTIVDGKRFWVKSSDAGDEDSGEEATPATTEATAAAAPVADDSSAGAGDDSTDTTKSSTAKTAASTAAAPATRKPSVHLQYLAATKKYGINYVPRIEYGGTDSLPLEARSIGGDGEIAKPDRFSAWGADLLNPLTWTDLSRTVDSYFKPYVKDNPQLTGMLWRIRCDRMQISYTRSDVELFCQETNTPMPDLAGKAISMWASSGDIGAKYAEWWHQKREQFHAKLVAQLQGYRPDMTLYYYNWEADKFAIGPFDMNTAATFTEVATARYGLAPEVYDRHIREQKALTGDDYVRMVRLGQLTPYAAWGIDYGIHTELYKDLKGMQVFCPADTLYLANNPTYLNYFQGSDGLAVSNAVSYDEGGARSINPKYEGNMMTPGGANFSMALELMAYFHGDARTLTWTAYTYGRGFADAHRRFAQAYLALPAIPGTVVDQPDADLKVRTYASANGTYVGVAYKGYAAKKITVKVPAKAGAKVTNLVTNETVPTTVSGDQLQFDIDANPMELDAYLVQ